MSDALWRVMINANVDFADMLIFLPSRRAVRTVEKMIVEKSGRAVVLPRLVALGEAADDFNEFDADMPDGVCDETISNIERIVLLTRMLAEDGMIGRLDVALPIARDLVRMQDYLENEGIDASGIDWEKLVDEKYAGHFQHKARILSIVSNTMNAFGKTDAMQRNRGIRNWAKVLDKYKFVIVCASTASVPATADLMTEIALLDNGAIILPGKIRGRSQDFVLDTNPYNCEYKFLNRINVSPEDVIEIDVGQSCVDFMNFAFGNDTDNKYQKYDLLNCHLIECPRESVEAAAVAQIALRAQQDKKSVLVITPDAAGGQRINQELVRVGINADFSSGVSGTMVAAGRAILNLLDEWIDTGVDVFDKCYQRNNHNLFNTFAQIVSEKYDNFAPQFVIDDEDACAVWMAIKQLSDALRRVGVVLNIRDARAFILDVLSSVSVRGVMNDAVDVCVLGTIESRMQTADIVVLTGLNDGMFPAQGYENEWLPRFVSEKIGLPSSDRKVALQALDFINLSCGSDVYWLRSRVSGGVQTTESRFLSRVWARRGCVDVQAGDKILADVFARDMLDAKPLDYSAPAPPPDWSDVYVTELELLAHNPYAFYVRHLLRLYPKDDYWVLPDARKFGDLVHSVLEKANDFVPEKIIHEMDRRALDLLGRDSILFHFWHKRFVQIAPIACQVLQQLGTGVGIEVGGVVKIAGRNVCARADRIWDGGVMDIKTGAAPNKKQLLEGNMPQLPIEAFMLQCGGFPIRMTSVSKTPIMMFLQLKNNDVRTIVYDEETTQKMIDGAVARVTDLFNIYSAGGAPYQYLETNDMKYRAYDDLARIGD